MEGSLKLIDDEELLSASGLPSVPTLKKVLGVKLLQPRYQTIDGGGRKRAWAAEDVQIARAIVSLAEYSGFSLVGAAALLQRGGRDWLERIAREWAAMGGEGCSEGPAFTVPSRLILCDLKNVWVEETHGLFRLVDVQFSDGPPSETPRSVLPKLLNERDVLGSCAVALVVAVGSLLGGVRR
ncbi:hypothetical protein [Caulobacter sp. Root1472]|uniref:hypothetical protein n=1 Tax=Caulobacter sp. Root1472 TaxID=1736470 RepID=UPI0012E3C826|nr:hypothetical protein [Caulobacter sp. Root1472]